jgi:hypothetical protein
MLRQIELFGMDMENFGQTTVTKQINKEWTYAAMVTPTRKTA